MKIKKLRKGGFTLIELLVVIAIIGILASAAMPAMNKALETAKISKDSSNLRQILLGCRSFATDWEGAYPNFDPDAEEEGGGSGDNAGFTTSTEAFNALIPQYIDQESIFWFQTSHPDKSRPPKEDGNLEAQENVYAYVTGQLDTSFSNSPLVADGLMDGPGEYGEYHPWLKSKKAVIAYCGGHVKTEKLTSAEPGATVRSSDGLVKNIFEKREASDEGESSGGWLSVDKDKVLLPE